MVDKKIITLCGQQTQIVLELGEYVEILHWGKKIDGELAGQTLSLSRPVPYGRLDNDVAMTLSPELGRGIFSSPGVEGHRDGQDWAPVFVIRQVEQGRNGVLIESDDCVAGLRLTTELLLDEHDVLQTRHTLTNIKTGVYQVNRLANTLPLPARAKELMTYYGRWVHEFQTVRQPLLQGGYLQENRRGRTSHEHYPALVVGTRHFDEMSGDVWGFHFAWSGNHRLRVDVKADGRRAMQAEVIYLPGEVALNEGESVTTPWLYASYSDMGLNGMSHHFHAHVRHVILPNDFKNKPRPIHMNTWEGIYFDHDPHYILSMAEQAAQMGVERFIIDDGWFKGRNGDKAGLGDWFLCEEKYPNGLQPIIERVNQLGMEFGLWFEPEMINKDSNLFRTHPDWLLAIEGYEQPTGRHQYVIDLQNDEAFHYLFERLDHFLSTYHIAYIKWDMNREVVQPAHFGRAAAHQQTVRYYQLVDKVRAKHPQVEIESCAAGGGRIDFEVLKRTHRFWPSDNNDALERQTIQRGMSYFFPPEVMGSHIGASHCHSTRRRHSIEFRGLTALFGHMGIELDPVKEEQAEKQGFERYIELHKMLRPLLHSGKTWRVPSDDDAHQIHAVVANDQSEAVVLIAQLAMPTNSLSGHFRLPGLAAEAIYRVTVLDKPSNYQEIVNYQPPWTESGCELSGAWCESVGLTMPILDAESAMLVRFERVPS
ncbi:alpha-galactosidase [Vibrio navarrensis]|uniref:alpha-galactosidase n=1 Tax=Vibrio navarrensis TaxID=29495 RepID=UPI00186A5FC6|nr:alpha-galactosidase [Vibrio navarrensis]MBE4591069.1 alpha-galactosidase [Vibrio navarrensis]